jgi:flagellar motility protein MotE (MotC chaperone)
VFKLIAFTFTLAAASGSHEPTPPTPPAGPTAPKEPEAPAAERKSEGGKGESKSAGASKGEHADKAAAEKPAAEKPADKAAAEKPADKTAPVAEKPGKPEKKGAGKTIRGGAVAPPPSLTGGALRQELKQGGEEKGAAPVSERARLEQLAADINKAREALKQDTARLEAMLRNGGGDGRMPLGDPSEPVASPGGPAASKEAMKEQILTVSKAMKGMKPEQAAAIISRLDRVLASEILRRMKPADAGAVMASIKPELAAELATAIATRKSMVDGDLKGPKK